MKSITLAILSAATLVAAVPTNFTESIPNIYPRDDFFDGKINFFSRWSCTNPCVESGYCLAGETDEGDLVNEEFNPMSITCWDRPHGAHAVSFAVDNGNGFTAIGKTCDEFKKDGYRAKVYYKGGSSDLDEPTCLKMNHHEIKAVFYNW